MAISQEMRPPEAGEPDDKNKRWKDAEKLINEATERDRPIDPRIKETVIALNILGLPTSQSCEGHIKKDDWPAPWIDIKDPDEPSYRFVGERELAERTMRGRVTLEEEQACISIQRDRDILKEIYKARPELDQTKGMEDTERREWWSGRRKEILREKLKEHKISFERYEEVAKILAEIRQKIEAERKEKGVKREEVSEYLEWRARNEELAVKARELLEEFYQGRSAPPSSSVELRVQGDKEKGFPIITNRKGKELTSRSLTKVRIEDLTQCQEEMQAFGKFLRKKVKEG